MIYEIQSKHALSTGAMLVIRIPEAEFDCKAFYTLQKDWPPFLLPFHCHNIDGQVECTYQLGSRTKLQYRFGTRTPKEYVEFWKQLLQPMLDCDDWFLRPYAFVMDTQYLYVERDGKTISYLYVPSMRDFQTGDVLTQFVSELAQQNPATDPKLENKTLRAIMENFNPRTFLEMLQDACPSVQPIIQTPPVVRVPPEVQMPVLPPESGSMPSGQFEKEVPMQQPVPSSLMADGDIQIDLHGDKDRKKGNPDKKKTKKTGIDGKKSGLFGRGNKEAKQERASEKKARGAKKGARKEVIMGAGAPSPVSPKPSVPNSVVFTPAPAVPTGSLSEKFSDATEIGCELGATGLCLVGNPILPKIISVDIEPGQTFTIGRFDVSLGYRQSSFEFDNKTKAVSRHHAVIQRNAQGYWIEDLASTAGTFVDGGRLQPNVPVLLERGCRVSFGTGGADYIWEESL